MDTATWEYYYFRNHYFDNFDFTDDRLVRTPVYLPRVEKYVTKLTPQHPDSIIEALDYILQKTRNSKEQFHFNLAWFTIYYEHSNLMIADNIFAHLSLKYWCSPEYDKSWADSVSIIKVCEKGPRISPSLIGETAPALNLPDTSGTKHNLMKIDAKYTLLFFWDSTCGHCKKQMPKMLELYAKYKDQGVELYNVNTEWETPSFKKYLREHDMQGSINVIDTTNSSRFRQLYDVESTPVLLMLDENKEIIARKIDADIAGEILEERLKKVN